MTSDTSTMQAGEGVSPRELVRAAGGVIVGPGRGRRAEILVVHRPRYDDWTLPKGKCNPGESDEACALREVEEETGLVCELGDEVAVARSEEHTSELQSPCNLVCRLLLEKKKIHTTRVSLSMPEPPFKQPLLTHYLS